MESHMELQAEEEQGWQGGNRRLLSLKSAAVALILAMHVLGLYFLTLPARQLKQATDVAFMMLMPLRPPPRVIPVAPSVPLPLLRPRSSTPLSRAPSPVSKPEAVASEAITPPVDELTVTPAAPAIDDLRTRARLSAGAIDKAMRGDIKKDQPWLVAPELESQNRFQKLVASAWRGGPIMAVEDYTLSDGRPATRVSSRGGSSCFAMAANPGAGPDPSRTGGKLQKVPCPH